jgi:hypothetical protein
MSKNRVCSTALQTVPEQPVCSTALQTIPEQPVCSTMRCELSYSGLFDYNKVFNIQKLYQVSKHVVETL